MSLQAGLLQPAADKAAAYSRHVYDIVAGTTAEVSKAAEATMADGQKKVLALVDTAVKNAPAGSESAVAMVKSAVAAANNAYESAHKAAQASWRSGRSQLHCDDQHGRQGSEGQEGRLKIWSSDDSDRTFLTRHSLPGAWN